MDSRLAKATLNVFISVAVVLALESCATRPKESTEPQPGIVVAPSSNEELTLGHAQMIAGTTVLRADLFVRSEGGFSSVSKGYGESVNILFIDPTQKTAHWLLPDKNHLITEKIDISDEQDPGMKRILATAFFVKLKNPQESQTGELLLVDPTGAKIVQVSADVTDLHLAALDGGELLAVYERNRQLVLAAFDPGTLAKKREQEIVVPPLQ